MNYPIEVIVDTQKHGRGGRLNLRGAKSRHAPLLARIANGSRLRVEALQGEWLAAEYGGKSGYVMAKFVRGSTEYSLFEGRQGKGQDTVKRDASKRYKAVRGQRLYDAASARQAIEAFSGEGLVLDSRSYLAALEKLAAQAELGYRQLDCSGYTRRARGRQGYPGATTNFARHCKYYGSIADLGGAEGLLPGMELYQGCRKSEDSTDYYMGHTGVYAGKHDFGDGRGAVHAVYQSSPGYRRLAKKYPKLNGPNLTAMNQAWNYWGWSRYLRL